jgi:flagellar biosynthesis anti-sigma factor FlgM
MKVNNHNDSVELSQLARSKRGEKASATRQKETGEAGAAVGAGAAAGVEISEEAKAMANANQIARADNTDQAKIDRIKAMIGAGTYKPDFGKVADKVVNETLLQELA